MGRKRGREGVQRVLGTGAALALALAPAAAGQMPAAPPPAAPAETRAMVLSLDDALKIASGQSEAVWIAQAGVKQARGNYRVARSGLLPQLSGSLQYVRTLRSQFGNISFQVPGATGSALSSLPFFQKNQYSLGLNLSQVLFDGGATAAQARAARARERAAGLDVTAAQAQVLLDVVQTYFDAQLSDQLVTIAEATLQENEQTLSLTQVAYKVGNKSEFELLRARVARDNQVPVVLERRTNRDEAYLRLKQLLNVPLDTRLTLITGVESLPERFAVVSDLSPDQRAAVRQALLNVTAGEEQIAASRAQRWPAISFVSSYDPVAYPTGGLPSPSDFRTNWTVGVDVTVPILTGGRIAGNEEVARGTRDEARARLSQVRKAADYDARAAQYDLAQAQAALAGNTSTVDEATRAYSIAQVRFREGLSTQIELTDARLQAEQAQSNRAQALRNVQVARARLALLKDLPLSTPTAPQTPVQPVAVSVPTPVPTNSLLGQPAMVAQPAAPGVVPNGGQP